VGASAAETVREIEDTRARLDAEFSELERRLPAPTRATKALLAVAIGGGTGATAFWFAARRLRKRAKRRREKTRPVVEAGTIVQVIPEKWAEALSDLVESGRWKRWAGLIGGAWLLLKLLELRQMRVLSRSLAR
jgi:hypothetical protein